MQVVNLLVTPEQAEQLSLAASQTQIQLVLRNPLDHEIAKTPGTALRHICSPAKHRPLERSSRTQRAARQAACRGQRRRAVRDGARRAPKKEARS